MSYSLKKGVLVPKREVPKLLRPSARRRLPDARQHVWFPRFVPVRAAVAVDKTGTLVTGTVSPVSSSTSITVTAGATAMWIVVQCDDGTASINAPTWNGVASTLIGSAKTSDNACVTRLYGLINPASGANALSVSWTGGAPNIELIAVSFTGTDTSSVAAAFKNFTSQVNNVASLSSTISVTSATGDIAVCAANGNNASLTLNQTSVYNSGANAAARAAGAASVTFNGTLSASVTNTIAGCDVAAPAVAGASLNWGFEPSPFQPPTYGSGSGHSKTFAAITKGHEGIDGTLTRFFPAGWEVEPHQPEHATPEQRGAAILKGDEGITGPATTAIRFVPDGWEVAPFQPPHRAPEWKAAAIMKGDEGTQGQLIRFFPYGWELPPHQPPHRAPEWKAAAILKGDEGITGPSTTVTRFFPSGWEIQSWQPQHGTRENRGAFLKGHEGIDAPFIFVPTTLSWGYEVTPAILAPVRGRALQAALDVGDDGTEGATSRWVNAGWEVQPHQPPHPRSENAGSVMRGDDGTEGIFINWRNSGWEIQPHQPPHPRYERAASIMAGEPGVEGVYVFVPLVPAAWGYETQDHPLRLASRALGGIRGFNQFAAFSSLPYGWEVHPFQPPYPLYDRAGALMVGVPGIDAPFIFVPPSSATQAWDIAPFQPPNQRRAPRWIEHAVNVDAPLVGFFPAGWEVAPFQPPHRTPEARAAAILKGHEGVDGLLVRFFPSGWEVAPFQPSHLRTERAGSIMAGEPGNEGVYVFVPPVPVAWGYDLPFYPPHPRYERAGALMVGSPGVDGRFVFVPPPFATEAWEIPSFQPPYRINRLEAMLRGDEGIEYPFVNWRNAGWEIQPHQPQHGTPEQRAAAVMKGHEGIDARFVRWFNAGWEVQPHQPQHASPERLAGAILKGDEGIEQVLLRWFNMGWEVQPFQPPHPRTERAGSIMLGVPGIDGVYVFVPSGALLQVDPNYITLPQGRVMVTYPQLRTVVTRKQ